LADAPHPGLPSAWPIQLEGELDESKRNKSKQKKAKVLSFPFFSFLESGLFKGLRPKKPKKSPLSQLAPQVVDATLQT
jgi:hypothetical protein